MTANVTLGGVPGQIDVIQTNATNVNIGLSPYGIGPLNCQWANVQTDAFGRSICTSNTPPVSQVLVSAPLVASGCTGGGSCSLSINPNPSFTVRVGSFFSDRDTAKEDMQEMGHRV